MPTKQNLTIQLSRPTIAKVKLLAVVRETSISQLVADVIEDLIREDDRYQEAQRMAERLLRKGFHLRGSKVSRDELHER